MKAIRAHQFGDPSVLKLDEVPDPVVGSGQVLIDVKAAGVNPYDTYIRSGQYAKLPPLPFTPGSDAGGIVESVGSGVDGFRRGDRVYIAGTAAGPTIGAYAQKTLCLPDQVHPLPKHLSFAQGAAVNVPYVTAWRAVFDKGGAKPMEVVLVHGASGGVGIPAVQMARAAGLTVFGTASTEKGRALVREHGAHDVFDHSMADYQKQILDKTGGRGVDLIIEMLANVNLVRDLEMIARYGRVVVVGSRGSIELNPRLVMAREAVVTGLTMWAATPKELAAAHAAVAAGLEAGALKPEIGQEMPLADAPRAHEAVMKPGAHGKIVLICPPS
jgi:NADPH2:quinone reductase